MKTLGFILQLVLCSAALQAQELETNWTGDTSRAHGVGIVDPGFALGKTTLLLPASLQPGGRFGSLLFMDEHPALPPLLPGGSFALKADLLAPYRLQRQRDKQLSTLYTVLGAVELGGVAYVAYRHIKKYGFLK